MIWDLGKGKEKNWILASEGFRRDEVVKYDGNMCLGNGYMCIRSVEDEGVPENRYSTLVAGMFNRVTQDVTHVQPLSDFTNIVFTADGTDIRPLPVDEPNTDGKNYTGYLKKINLYDGLLTRTFTFTLDNGKQVQCLFERVVPLEELHLYAAKVTLTALDDDIHFTVKAGITSIEPKDKGACINFRTAASDRYISHDFMTAESKISIAMAVASVLTVSGEKIAKKSNEQADGNVYENYEFTLNKGETAVFEKYGTVYTDRDLENEGLTVAQIDEKAKNAVVSCPGFDKLYADSAAAWKKLWDVKDVQIDTKRDWDQLTIRFAIYHLTITDPRHDGRMNIGARGLQGGGYNNHVFWDTEIFMLPFFTFTEPTAARKLLEYRYYGLDGARRKALELGFNGAMYPWEAAWETDGETTPTWADSGKYEHHITGDVTQAIFSYCATTGDYDFMEKYGYEILFDTAKYWVSRVTYNGEKDRYDILNTIGPDENREHINNNAFTNYIAHRNVEYAAKHYDEMAKSNPEKLDGYIKKLGLEGIREKWTALLDKMYLPRENADGIVPQDDTYLADYAERQRKFEETGEAPHGMSKQADVMVLFLLFEDLFTAEIKKKNYYFYEPLCYHGSSLSRSSYTVLSADIGETDVAYDMYWDASQRDIGDGHYSRDGICTAGAGGLWQCVVFGFMGVRLYGTGLRIQPNLPKNWSGAHTTFYFQGVHLDLTVDGETIKVKRLAGDHDTSFLCNGKTYTFADSIEIKY